MKSTYNVLNYIRFLFVIIAIKFLYNINIYLTFTYIFNINIFRVIFW